MVVALTPSHPTWLDAAGTSPEETFELVPEAVCVIRADGEYVYWNARALEIIRAQHPGVGLDAVGEVRWSAVDIELRPIPEGDTPAEAARRTGVDARDAVIGLPRADGTRGWVRISTRALRHEGPPPYDVVVTFSDVTAERDAAARLDEANTLFATAFEGAPIGMALVALDGRLLDVNRALGTLLGLQRDELLRASLQDITHPEDLEADLGLMRQCMVGEVSSYQLDKRYLHASGRVISASLSVSVVRHADGTPAHFVSQVQDVTQQRELERRLRELAQRDPLTGLPNRRSFDDALGEMVEQARSGSVVMLDLDHFKALNDRAGHVEGDRFLVEVGTEIQRALRTSDVVARLGGDEFAVLLDGARAADAERVGAELVAAVRAVTDRGWPSRVTASTGIATLHPGETARSVMLRADRALYAAKDAGRDGTVVAG